MADLPDLTPDAAHAKSDDVALKSFTDNDAGASLDALAKSVSDAKGGAPILDDAAAAAEAARAKAAAAAKGPEAGASGAAAAPPVEDEATKAAAQAEADRKAAEAVAQAEADRKAAEAAQAESDRKAAETADPFLAHQLPPNAKSKSAEAFDNLKQAARDKVAEVARALTESQNKITELTSQLEEAKKTSGVVPPEILAELKTLREEHAALDVKADPEFQKFDSAIQTNVEMIFKKLADTGVAADAVEKIKEIGVDNVDWAPILDKLPVQARRFIEATLVDNERARLDKEKAITKATSNATEYTKQRLAREQQSVKAAALEFTKSFDWMALKEVPAAATAEEKAALDAHNAEAQQAMNKLNSYLDSRSPERYAELAVGTVLAYKWRAKANALEQQIATLKADKTLDTITKERDKLKSELDAIKRAQIPRNRGDAIIPPAPLKKADLNTSADESLDALAKQVVAQREE